MWSFIGSKHYKVWIWLAIDSLTKEIVGLYVGDRILDSVRLRRNRDRATARGIAIDFLNTELI
ncbi:MAG: hypothetical protein ACOC04_01830 [Halothece sp.]